MPGYYDEDLVTDFAVYRPGSSTNGTAPPTSPSKWLYCPSTLYGPGKQPYSACTETTAVQVTFGQRRDIPLGNLDVDGNAATGEVGVFTPATNTYSYRNVCAGCATSTLTGAGSTVSAEPFPGLYDADGKTDFVTYEPISQAFNVRLSSEGYVGVHTVSGPTAAGCGWGVSTVVVPDMFSFTNNGPRQSYTVYDTKSGCWNNVASLGGTTSTCQWGQIGDVPLGGFFNTPSNLTVFRPGYEISEAGYPQGNLITIDSACTPSSVQVLPSYNGRMTYPVGAISDMTGDGHPEYIQLEPAVGVTGSHYYIFRSETNYLQNWAVVIGDVFSVVL